MAGARAWILDQLDAERSRWMLWLPVALGLGIAVYFELPSEPALWLGPALAAAALALVFFAPAGSLARAVAIGLVAARRGLRPDRLAHRERCGADAEPAPVQHQRRRPHRRHPAPARGRARRARGGAPEGQRCAARRDDANQAARVADQGRAAPACRRSHPGAGQPLAALGTGRTRRLRFPARRLVPAARRRGLCAGARGGDRSRQARRLRAHHRRAARRRRGAHHEGAARPRRRRGRGPPGRRADRGRQGHRPGDARFRAWPTSCRSRACTSCSSSPW